MAETGQHSDIVAENERPLAEKFHLGPTNCS